MTKPERLVLAGCVTLFLAEGAVLVYRTYLEARVESCARCLPEELQLSTEFGVSPEPISSTTRERKTTTVRKALFRVGAYCQGGQIYDNRGRKVFFHHPYDRGIPPHPGQEEKALEELERLKKEGTVILMYQPQASL
jgi:hypothetical protein